MEMAKMVVRGWGKVASGKEFENNWRALYAHYVWLALLPFGGLEECVGCGLGLAGHNTNMQAVYIFVQACVDPQFR
jgi:hypothetical protein